MNLNSNEFKGGQEPLKILFVTPRYFPYIGGVENHVYQVARRLQATGSKVTILTTDPRGDLAEQELHESGTIRRVRAYPKGRDYYFAPGIHQVITQGEWDIVHLQSYHTFVAPFAMQAAWQAKIPYLVTFHGGGHNSRFRNHIRRMQRKFMQPLFAHAARLIATAQFEIEQYSQELHLPKDRFIYIPNGADIGDGVQTPDWQPEGCRIISVGRLEHYKGHQRVLAALPHILKKHGDARLWIAGEGSFRSELQAMARELGVTERVEIRSIPMADRQTMVNELSKMSLMVLLSEFETHPMSVLEAARLGVPVLVADTSGLSELADQGIARSIPLESSPSQVAEAVVKQLEQPLIPAKFDLPTWDGCASDLFTLYEQTVESARSGKRG